MNQPARRPLDYISHISHLSILQGGWLGLALLGLIIVVLIFALLRTVLQLGASVSLSLSLVCLVLTIAGWLQLYDRRMEQSFVHYQQRIVEDLQNLRVLSHQVNLERAFVSLRISKEFLNPAEQAEQEPETRLEQREARYETSIEIDEAVERFPALLILGEPGAGKTTLLRYLALYFAREPTILPLLIPLHEFAAALERTQADNKPLTLVDYLPVALQNAGFANSHRLLMKKLKRGEVILLLDALDEVPDDASRTRVLHAINQFVRIYGYNRVVATSRIAVYLATQGRLDRFQHAEVLEFTPAQMGQFARVLLSPADADRLERIFRAKRSLRNIGRNPLLLSVIVMVYKQDRSLPERRVDLYKRCIHVLLEQWEREKPVSRVDFEKFPVRDRLRRLEKIAFHFMHKGGAIDQDELIEQIQQQFDIPSTREALAFIDEIVRYSGILRQQSIHSYGFWHLSFQEYFSACVLDRQISASRAQAGPVVSRQQLSKLSQLLATRFDREELRTLCFNLGVDYDDLPSEGKANKARELVKYLERRQRIPTLVETGRKLRPDIPWKDQVPSLLSGPSSQPSASRLLAPYVSQPRWEETLLFLAGIQRDATELIKAIVTQEPDRTQGIYRAARCLVDGDRTKFAVRARIIQMLVDHLLHTSDPNQQQYAESVLTEIALVREMIAFLRWTLLQETDLATVARVGWIFARSDTPEVLQTFTQSLTDTRVWIRQWLIIGALQRLNVPECGQALRQAYPHLAADAQARVVTTVGAISEDRGATDFLFQELLNKDEMPILIAAVQALLQSVDVGIWIKRLEQEANKTQLYRIAPVLADVAIQQTDEFESLHELVTHPILQDSFRKVLSKRSLAQVETEPAQNPDPVAPRARDQGQKAPDRAYESSIFEADFWREQDDGAAQEDLNKLITAFHNAAAQDDWVVQTQYLVDIANFQEEQATQVLIQALDPSCAWPVRQIAAGLLASRGRIEAQSAILAARDAPPTHFIDNRTPEALRKSLATFGPLLRNGVLYEWESSMDQALRRLQATEASSHLSGGEKDAELLENVTSRQGAIRLRWQSVSLLGERGCQEAIPVLLQILDEEKNDRELRRRAAVALGAIKNPAATKTLQDQLAKENHWDIQVACANALAEIGTIQAFQALISALLQVTPPNRADIVCALRRFSIPLDTMPPEECFEMLGQAARQADVLDPDMYQVLDMLYQDVLVKAGLETP